MSHVGIRRAVVAAPLYLELDEGLQRLVTSSSRVLENHGLLVGPPPPCPAGAVGSAHIDAGLVGRGGLIHLIEADLRHTHCGAVVDLARGRV
eukprot:CAMPEP_0171087530 /NCGR_PEP_ID=MMETSP0766_2-20121228/20210_1 /TAXON_ID=439317 /ORGANISM="Gambierdiscus australes, Strain CAWD 149" /LENGTH=91 /DNA_ID=CAMNT_0011545243 /DNA_START=95 /DNA_END=366 /DNA_ORIENTATION=-